MEYLAPLIGGSTVATIGYALGFEYKEEKAYNVKTGKEVFENVGKYMTGMLDNQNTSAGYLAYLKKTSETDLALAVIVGAVTEYWTLTSGYAWYYQLGATLVAGWATGYLRAGTFMMPPAHPVVL